MDTATAEQTLQSFLDVKVAALMRRKDMTGADAVMSIVAARKTVWTRAEWNARLAELNQSQLTVAEWLPLNT